MVMWLDLSDLPAWLNTSEDHVFWVNRPFNNIIQHPKSFTFEHLCTFQCLHYENNMWLLWVGCVVWVSVSSPAEASWTRSPMWRGECYLLHPPDPGSPAAHVNTDTVMPDVKQNAGGKKCCIYLQYHHPSMFCSLRVAEPVPHEQSRLWLRCRGRLWLWPSQQRSYLRHTNDMICEV